MPLKTRDIEDKLLNKFKFNRAPNHASDHKWFELTIPGLGTLTTKISHGSSEIDDSLIGMMARQVRVNSNFFKQMISCTKSRDDFIRQISSDPYPPFDN